MNLYLKHRPKKLEQVIGNKETVSALQGMLESQDCPQAFLFTGPKGNGKTTLARIVARRLGCKGQDLREMDSADFRGIDVIREIRKQSQYVPLEGKCRVWIMDEVHQLSKDAQSAMLKMLEDTPKNVYFILCTTDPQKLLPTVRDRCSQFPLKPLTDIEMKKLLKRTVKAEEERLPKKAYQQIIQDSFGHPRTALQILDQVLRVDWEKRIQTAKKSAEEQSESIALCRALIQGEGWKKVSGILRGLKDQDAEAIRRHVLGYTQSVLLNEDNERAGLVLEEFTEPFYDSGFPQLVYACYSVVKN